MSAQREGGSVRVVVMNLTQADLIGDGIDYTVGGHRAPYALVDQKNVKSGTVLEPGTPGQPT